MTPTSVIERFREIVRADRDAGALRPLAAYLPLFAGQPEQVLREEYERIASGERAAPAGPQGADAAAASEAATIAPAPDSTAGRLPATPMEAPTVTRLAVEPAPAAAPHRPAGSAPASAGTTGLRPIAGVEELGEIGRGGMGAILRVRDEALRRELAMKVALPGLGGSGGEALARFVGEARIQAQLDHPGVVPIHALGRDAAGRVSFTMKLVRGRSLAEIDAARGARAEGADLTRAVQTLLRVCETMAYAHEKGIIHRDLKPANVMVGSFGEVYVMDWGLAKDLSAPAPEGDSTPPVPAAARTTGAPEAAARGTAAASTSGRTQAGSVLGTPAYMPPEQARGEIAQIGTRSDVYALGAMLYETLAGRAPYATPGRQQTSFDILRAVLDGPPPPLLPLAPRGTDELAAVAEKAMARDPAARYATARELGEDLQRWIEGRVVRAHRTGAFAEAVKWVRRNRAVAGLAALLVAVLTGAWVRFTVLEAESLEEIRKERDAAVDARREADRAARVSDGLRLATLATSAIEKDPALAGLLALEAHGRAPGPETMTAIWGAIANLAEERTLTGSASYFSAGVWSADGATVWTADRSGRVVRWDAAAGRALTRAKPHAGPVTRLALLDGGTRLFSASAAGSLRILDPQTLAVTWSHDVPGRGILDCAVSPDGTRVAVAADDAWVVDLAANAASAAVARFRGHGTITGRVAWSPSGDRVASGGADYHVRVWDAASGAELVDLPCATARPGAFPATVGPEFGERLPAARWCAGGTRIVTWVAERWPGLPKDARAVRIFDAATGEALPLDAKGGASLPSAAVVTGPPLDDGTVVVAGPLAGRDADAILDVATGRIRPAPWEDGTQASRLVAVSPDRRLLAFITENSTTVVIVDAATGARRRTFRGHKYNVNGAAFSADGRRLLTLANDATARIWSVTPPDVRRGLADRLAQGGEFDIGGLDQDGRLVGVRWHRTPGAEAQVFVGDTASGADVFTAPPGARHAIPSPDGRRVLVVHPDRLDVHEMATGAVTMSVAVPEAAAARFSPRGDAVAFRAGLPGDGGPDQTVYLVGVPPGAPPGGSPALPLRRFDSPADPTVPNEKLGALVVSADGRVVGAALGYVGIVVWDVATGEVRHVGRSHRGFVHSIACDAAGERFATFAQDSSVRIWDLAAGRAGTVTGLPLRRGVVTFDAGGTRIAAAAPDTILLAAAGTGAESARIAVTGSPCWELRFTTDDRLAALHRDGTVRIWPTEGAAALAAQLPRDFTPLEMDRHRVGTPAERALRAARALTERPAPRDAAAVCRRLADAGLIEEAARLAEATLAADAEDGYSHVAAAVVADARGQNDAGFDALRRAAECGVALEQTLTDPAELPALRRDARWKDIVAAPK